MTAPFDHKALGDAKPVRLFEREPRHTAVLLGGSICVDGEDHRCRIRDISRHGMQIDALPALRPEQRVVVTVRGQSLAGWIVWVRDGRAGVKLVKALAIDRLLP